MPTLACQNPFKDKTAKKPPVAAQPKAESGCCICKFMWPVFHRFSQLAVWHATAQPCKGGCFRLDRTWICPSICSPPPFGDQPGQERLAVQTNLGTGTWPCVETSPPKPALWCCRGKIRMSGTTRPTTAARWMSQPNKWEFRVSRISVANESRLPGGLS